jgi:hypothetical protein
MLAREPENIAADMVAIIVAQHLQRESSSERFILRGLSR